MTMMFNEKYTIENSSSELYSLLIAYNIYIILNKTTISPSFLLPF